MCQEKSKKAVAFIKCICKDFSFLLAPSPCYINKHFTVKHLLYYWLYLCFFLLRISEVHTLYIGQSHPFLISTPPRFTAAMHSPPPNFVTSISRPSLCCLFTQVWSQLLKHGWPTSAHFLKRNWLSLPRSIMIHNLPPLWAAPPMEAPASSCLRASLLEGLT